jgi:hypothetical protein
MSVGFHGENDQVPEVEAETEVVVSFHLTATYSTLLDQIAAFNQMFPRGGVGSARTPLD